jgi:hypothetical protein
MKDPEFQAERFFCIGYSTLFFQLSILDLFTFEMLELTDQHLPWLLPTSFYQ